MGSTRYGVEVKYTPSGSGVYRVFDYVSPGPEPRLIFETFSRDGAESAAAVLNEVDSWHRDRPSI